MTCGVALADGFYILAALAGAARLLEVYWLKKALIFAGSAVLARFGLMSLLYGNVRLVDTYPAGANFSAGLKLALANPLTVLFWTGTFGSLLASGQVPQHAVLSFSAGCAGATVLFLGSVSAGGGLLRSHLQERYLVAVNRAVGVFVLLFAAGLLFT
jgi:threonine/homoserine/homoserine lactone efflux protein